jgi:TonB-dependent SusC/RagA subfamily outer membrane receptor
MNKIGKLVQLSFLVMIGMSNSFAQNKGNNVTVGTYVTIYDMLKDVPGLEVKTDNTKSGGTIIVRGTGSLNNQKPPLIVVDGAIYSGDITNINPQDVDGISVLKDAASATAYGAQGASGVILINLKKGTTGVKSAVVEAHNESAYTYFIQHKTPLRVFGFSDEIIVEGVIQKQVDSSLVFIKKRKDFLVQIKQIKRVEMIKED